MEWFDFVNRYIDPLVRFPSVASVEVSRGLWYNLWQMTQHKYTEVLQSLPTKPGVYLYKNAAGKVIYVGKAVNLRARVSIAPADKSCLHIVNDDTRCCFSFAADGSINWDDDPVDRGGLLEAAMAFGAKRCWLDRLSAGLEVSICTREFYTQYLWAGEIVGPSGHGHGHVQASGSYA